MVEIRDFSSWSVYDGASEGSGRSEKVWLKSPDGQIGLFKFPRSDAQNPKGTTEHLSEHLACKLGRILDVPTAQVDLGIRDGRMGSMSYSVCDFGEELREGIGFISGKYPKYNAETLTNEENNTYYCIDYILQSVPKRLPKKIWIEMMMFDFLIGNSDRHQSNWALLYKATAGTQSEFTIRQCPLYDNGSSLCSFINETQVPSLLGKDVRQFHALVDSKSRSLIRIDGTKKKRPSHREVANYLLQRYSVTKDIAVRFLERLNEDVIVSLLAEYPENILSPSKSELMKRYLLKKLEILDQLLKEVSNDVANK